MKETLTRRDFIAAATTTAAGLGLHFGPPAPTGRAAEPDLSARLSKALILESPTEEKLKQFKDAGFDGIEGGILKPQEAEKVRGIAERLDLKVHSVIRGWAEFNSRDKSKADASFAVTEDALRAAQAYGAGAVLLVPCRIGGMRMPRPWEFVIDFDEQTGHVRKVVYGDNAPYQDYIAAHNHAVDTSREAVKRLIPLAEQTGAVVALENVWNNLWVKPAIFRNFVASFQSPWVKAYFDIGNHVKYTPSEEWILTLGELLAKCHVKDFKVNRSDPKGEGSFVNIRDGDVRWPVVRAALDRVGYNGWMTIEGGDLSLAEHSRRLDLIIAGQ